MKKVMKTKDEQFIDWECSVFGYGYGSGEMYTLQTLKDFFSLLQEERNYDFEILEKELGGAICWLMINILCSADILEYGTSSRYGWLSEKGEKLRDYLKTKTVDDLYNLVMYVDEEKHIRCGIGYCNCDSPKNHRQTCINNELL
uniref:Uncharacterized protein n=1 Tax=viral metagenome TaxID=1070528 RepID=A0A6M3XT75_9ZZZZ